MFRVLSTGGHVQGFVHEGLCSGFRLLAVMFRASFARGYGQGIV